MQRDDADEARAPRASHERSGSSRAKRRAPWIGTRWFFADPRVKRGARARVGRSRARDASVVARAQTSRRSTKR